MTAFFVGQAVQIVTRQQHTVTREPIIEQGRITAIQSGFAVVFRGQTFVGRFSIEHGEQIGNHNCKIVRN